MPTLSPADSQAVPHSPTSYVGQWMQEFIHGDQQAFGLLVHRFTPLVLAVALRRTGGNIALAQDVAQIVFIDLARRIRTLRADATLGGWLHQRSLHAAADIMKSEQRRIHREQKAAQFMPDTWKLDVSPQETNSLWADCQPMVDQALDQLSNLDRTAVLLRYAEGEDLRTVASTLGCSVDAAKKRATRALEKLRRILSRKHPTLTVAALMTGLAADQSQAGTLASQQMMSSLSAQALQQAARLGPVTLWERAMPALKSATAGSAAAGLLWSWPLAQRWYHSAEASTPATTATTMKPPTPAAVHFPASPTQSPLKPGLSLDEIVRAIAALAEGPNFPDAWERMGFFRKQLSKEQYPAFLRSLHGALSAEGWNAFIKRDWAEGFFETWAGTDVVAALEFLLARGSSLIVMERV